MLSVVLRAARASLHPLQHMLKLLDDLSQNRNPQLYRERNAVGSCQMQNCAGRLRCGANPCLLDWYHLAS